MSGSALGFKALPVGSGGSQVLRPRWEGLDGCGKGHYSHPWPIVYSIP